MIPPLSNESWDKVAKDMAKFITSMDFTYFYKTIRLWEEAVDCYVGLYQKVWKLVQTHPYGRDYERTFGSPKIGQKDGRSVSEDGSSRQD